MRRIERKLKTSLEKCIRKINVDKKFDEILHQVDCKSLFLDYYNVRLDKAEKRFSFKAFFKSVIYPAFLFPCSILSIIGLILIFIPKTSLAVEPNDVCASIDPYDIVRLKVNQVCPSRFVNPDNKFETVLECELIEAYNSYIGVTSLFDLTMDCNKYGYVYVIANDYLLYELENVDSYILKLEQYRVLRNDDQEQICAFDIRDNGYRCLPVIDDTIVLRTECALSKITECERFYRERTTLVNHFNARNQQINVYILDNMPVGRLQELYTSYHENFIQEGNIINEKR